MVERMREMLATAAAAAKPRARTKRRQAARQDPVPAERPEATGGGAAKRPAAANVLAAAAMGAPLKRPAAAGPARKEHAKPAAAGPARAKPAPATKGLPMGWRTQVSIRKSGASAGVKDTYYWSPDGIMYRSYREAFGSARR